MKIGRATATAASLAAAAADAGRLFVYETTREGVVSKSDVNVYGNVFALYGLSAYAQASGNQEALQLAKHTFWSLDKLFHSTATGGYDETTADFSLDSIQLLGCWNSSSVLDRVSAGSVGYVAGRSNATSDSNNNNSSSSTLNNSSMHAKAVTVPQYTPSHD